MYHITLDRHSTAATSLLSLVRFFQQEGYRPVVLLLLPHISVKGAVHMCTPNRYYTMIKIMDSDRSKSERWAVFTSLLDLVHCKRAEKNLFFHSNRKMRVCYSEVLSSYTFTPHTHLNQLFLFVFFTSATFRAAAISSFILHWSGWKSQVPFSLQLHHTLTYP